MSHATYITPEEREMQEHTAEYQVRFLTMELSSRYPFTEVLPCLETAS